MPDIYDTITRLRNAISGEVGRQSSRICMVADLEHIQRMLVSTETKVVLKDIDIKAANAVIKTMKINFQDFVDKECRQIKAMLEKCRDEIHKILITEASACHDVGSIHKRLSELNELIKVNLK